MICCYIATELFSLGESCFWSIIFRMECSFIIFTTSEGLKVLLPRVHNEIPILDRIVGSFHMVRVASAA